MKQHCEAGKRKGNTITSSFVACLVVCGLGVMVALTGCKDFFRAVNNPPPGTGSSSFVYVTNLGSGGSGGTLTEYSLTSGVLAQLSGSPITLPATPTSIVVAPNNKFLFVGCDLGVFLYTIAANGTLTEGNNNTIVFQGPSQAQSLAVDATSSWLVVANRGSAELDALPINPTTGVPTSNTPASVTLRAASPRQVTISPANDNIFVALGAGGTDALSFSATGTKALGTPVHIGLHSTSTAANAVAVDTTSTYLFIGETTSNLLRQIAISDLSKDVSDYPVGKAPASILADATGAYVYVANGTDNSITGFSLSAGALTELSSSPFATSKAPIGLIEDSSKKYVFSAGFGANPNLWEYNFDATSAGTLDIQTTTSTATTNPSSANGIAATH